LLGLATLAMYVFVYTPMKRITPAATLVGAVPGALPPVMGWAALRHDITPQIGLLFAILFIWQMPHFLSLAWLYRRDYARAGYKLLTTGDVDGTRTGRHILGYTLGLLPLAILPGVVDGVHPAYITAAALLGISFSCLAVLFARSRSQASARNLFLASLLYLPALLVFLVACAD
jgi:protoheme IX farnesyltransferase